MDNRNKRLLRKVNAHKSGVEIRKKGLSTTIDFVYTTLIVTVISVIVIFFSMPKNHFHYLLTLWNVVSLKFLHISISIAQALITTLELSFKTCQFACINIVADTGLHACHDIRI